jgi:hypothetical protein
MGDVLHQGPFLAAQTPLRTRRLQTTGCLSERARRKFELRRAFSGERARREQKALGKKNLVFPAAKQYHEQCRRVAVNGRKQERRTVGSCDFRF